MNPSPWFATLVLGIVVGVTASATGASVSGGNDAPASAAPTPGSTVGIGPVAEFTVDLGGGSGRTPTGAWWSISGGDQNIEIVTYTSGTDGHQQGRPEQPYLSDITIKGPFVPDRKALMKWINAFSKDGGNGRKRRIDATLSFVDDRGYDLLTIDLDLAPATSSVTPHAPGFRTASPVNLTLFEYDTLGPVYMEIKMQGQVVFESQPAEGAPVLAVLPSTDPPEDFPDGRTIMELNVGAVTIGRPPGDTTWMDWFESHNDQGDIRVPVLRYLNASGGEVHAYDFHRCWPTRYEVINLDSRSGPSSLKEVLELSVERAEYRPQLRGLSGPRPGRS